MGLKKIKGGTEFAKFYDSNSYNNIAKKSTYVFQKKPNDYLAENFILVDEENFIINKFGNRLEDFISKKPIKLENAFLCHNKIYDINYLKPFVETQVSSVKETPTKERLTDEDIRKILTAPSLGLRKEWVSGIKINECIVVTTNSDDKYLLAKRGRSSSPSSPSRAAVRTRISSPQLLNSELLSYKKKSSS